MPRLIDNARHWRERAAEARAIAEKLIDGTAKQKMLDVAKSYDRLAEHAKARGRETPDEDE